MTVRPPVPARPRLGTRLAYWLQRLLRPPAGARWLSARIEASGLARRLFTGGERQGKEGLFGCRMCGQCALPVTGYVAIKVLGPQAPGTVVAMGGAGGIQRYVYAAMPALKRARKRQVW